MQMWAMPATLYLGPGLVILSLCKTPLCPDSVDSGLEVHQAASQEGGNHLILSRGELPVSTATIQGSRFGHSQVRGSAFGLFVFVCLSLPQGRA